MDENTQQHNTSQLVRVNSKRSRTGLVLIGLAAALTAVIAMGSWQHDHFMESALSAPAALISFVTESFTSRPSGSAGSAGSSDLSTPNVEAIAKNSPGAAAPQASSESTAIETSASDAMTASATQTEAGASQEESERQRLSGRPDNSRESSVNTSSEGTSSTVESSVVRSVSGLTVCQVDSAVAGLMRFIGSPLGKGMMVSLLLIVALLSVATSQFSLLAGTVFMVISLNAMPVLFSGLSPGAAC